MPPSEPDPAERPQPGASDADHAQRVQHAGAGVHSGAARRAAAPLHELLALGLHVKEPAGALPSREAVDRVVATARHPHDYQNHADHTFFCFLNIENIFSDCNPDFVMAEGTLPGTHKNL